MVKRFHCKARWSDNNETQHDFTHMHEGTHRVVYTSSDRAWVVKAQVFLEKQKNYNISE